MLAPFAVVAVWVRNEVLDTSRYVDNVAPLASNPDVVNTVANNVTAALFDQIDVQQAAEQALPPRAEFLAGPLTTGLRDFTFRTAVSVLSSKQFQEIWRDANRVAHQQLRKALTNEGTVITTENGKVVLDLSPLVEQVRLALKQRGIGVFDRIPADRLGLRFELMDASNLSSAQRATRVLQTLRWVLPITALACLGFGLALSTNRRRSLVRWGIGTAFAAAVLGAGVGVGRSLYLDAVTGPSLPRATAAAVFDTLVRYLRDGVRLVILLGLVVAVGAWLSGPGRLATKVRATIGRAGTSAGARGWTFGEFGHWVAAHRMGCRVGALLIALVVLTLWNHPRPATVLALVVVLAVVWILVEVVARAATADHRVTPAG